MSKAELATGLANSYMHGADSKEQGTMNSRIYVSNGPQGIMRQLQLNPCSSIEWVNLAPASKG
eukprot:1140771-Pelagomonas_calceolata.AAC.22